MGLYKALVALGRPRSFLGKVLLVSFLGVHVPLIAVVIYLLLSTTVPLAELAPVLIVLLVATVAGTVATSVAIYALLAPVRSASSAIRAFLARKETSALPTHYPDQAGVLMADVQEAITRLDRALDAARAAADRAEEDKAAKFGLLSRMSHDLRTPLNHILGFSEMIQNEMLGPLGQKAYARYAGDIRDSGTELLELVQAVLEMSELEAGTYDHAPEPLDPAPLVRECVDLTHLAAERAGVRLESDLPVGVLAVQADARAFKQVLSHYLLAVVRKAEAGGWVRIALRDGPRGPEVTIEDTCGPLTADDTRGLGARTTAAEDDGSGELIESASGFALTLMLVNGLMRVQDGAFEVVPRGDGGKLARLGFPAAAAGRAAA